MGTAAAALGLPAVVLPVALLAGCGGSGDLNDAAALRAVVQIPSTPTTNALATPSATTTLPTILTITSVPAQPTTSPPSAPSAQGTQPPSARATVPATRSTPAQTPSPARTSARSTPPTRAAATPTPRAATPAPTTPRAAPTPPPPVAGGTGDSAAYESRMIALINAQRAAVGAHALTAQGCPDAYAQAWSPRMAAAGSISHQSLTPILSGCRVHRAAENVGMTTDQPADAMMALFMASSPHRANLLDPALTGIGVAAYRDARGIWWVTQDFVG